VFEPLPPIRFTDMIGRIDDASADAEAAHRRVNDAAHEVWMSK
jgi:hypothetical protein